ncbi:MAG TPA: 2Fe-2S iron-sulfur cluster-binding protein [Saprospiraceae bacterium]|nr:2Fe-2S iron-sulfur cluster-binding protein [Saprospiraceae bacterium]HQW56200.1 2Fe-2S iron-sulfur cluster-binding protein [Saprospiraceae bacterium]
MDHNFYTLIISDIKTETEDSKVIVFTIPEELKENFRWSSGQNITLRFYDEGVEQRRSYSINTAPFESSLQIGVRAIPEGKFSQRMINELRPGSQLEVMPPTGSFTLGHTPATCQQFVFIAAGSGITPVISLIKDLLTNHHDSQVMLIYGNRQQSTIMFREELEDLKDRFLTRFQLVYLLSRESLENEFFSSRINAVNSKYLCEKFITQPQSANYFLCGPEAMVMEVRDMLFGELNIPAEQVHFELFFTGAMKADETPEVIVVDSEVSRLTIIMDGKESVMDLAYEGDVILDRGIEEGLDLPYACHGGVCSTCKAKLIKGEVEMDSNFSLEQDEIKAGYILTCQSHPRSPEVVVNYDY